MTILVVGTSNKLSINYLNYVVAKQMESLNFDEFVIPKVEYICIDNKIQSKEIQLQEEMHTNFKYYNLEINKENIDNLLTTHNVTHVINFHEVKNTTKEEYTKHNFDFVIDLYESCVEYKVEHLTHISTSNVYGNSKQTYCDESTHLKATCDYTSSKINADLFLLSQNKVKTAILRVCELFGSVKTNNFIDNIITSIYDENEIIINEDNDFIRSYMNVDDCIYFVINASSNKITGAYNVCSDFHLKAKDIINQIVKVFDYKKEVIFTKEQKVILQHCRVDGSKITKLLHYDLTKQKENFDFFLTRILHEYEIHQILKDMSE